MAVHLAVAVMSMMCLFVLSFIPRDVLDEIMNLIESVSEGFLRALIEKFGAEFHLQQ